MEILAAVTRRAHGEFSLEKLTLDEPCPGEVRVRIVAVGICHTDVIARNQVIPVPLPCVLGH